jgi:hypothetical protein
MPTIVRAHARKGTRGVRRHRRRIQDFITARVQALGCSAEDINNGRCQQMAETIVAEYPRTSIWTSDAGSRLPIHFFVERRGRFYDVEAPRGVSNPADLPLFVNASKNNPSEKLTRAYINRNVYRTEYVRGDQ